MADDYQQNYIITIYQTVTINTHVHMYKVGNSTPEFIRCKDCKKIKTFLNHASLTGKCEHYLVANSTPIVLLLSMLNSLRVNRDSRLVLPTPESPTNTTETITQR